MAFILGMLILLPLQSTAADVEATECHPAGITLIENADITIFGEFHGTNEIQPMFFDIVCHYSFETEGNMLVGLELSKKLTPIFNAEYASPDEFISTVLGSKHWGPYGDGRHSPAMAELLLSLHKLRDQRNGKLVIVGLVEKAWDEIAPGRITRLLNESEISKTLILVGNWHARKTIIEGYPEFPFALNMLKYDRTVATFDVWAKSGEIWACTDRCGVMDVYPRETSVTENGLYDLACDSNTCPYDGFMYFDELSVSR